MSSIMFYVITGLRALKRDWSSGELRLLAIAIITAVAAVGSVSFLSDRVGQAINADAAQTLGGDLVIRSGTPLPAEFEQYALSLNLNIAHTVEFPSMVSGLNSSQLAAIKAVSNNYPLKGQIKTYQGDPANRISQAVNSAPPQGEVWVDPQLMQQLNINTSQSLHVGDASFPLTAVIAYESDRSMQFVNIAPRVLMRLSDLDSTGLLGVGSRVSYRFIVVGSQQQVAQFHSWVKPLLKPDQQISTIENNRPELQRALDRAHHFLSLVALLTIMLAAVAIALAARRFYLRHQDGIAVMRCLGASERLIARMLWVEFLALAVIASIAGLVLAYGIQHVLAYVVSVWLDIALPYSSILPYLRGLLTGFLLLLGFAIPSLIGLRKVSPVRVLHKSLSLLDSSRIGAFIIGVAVFLVLIISLSQSFTLGAVLAASFMLAITVFVIVALMQVGLVGWLRRKVNGAPLVRFALNNLVRRKLLSVVQLISLAMALTILLLLAIMRTDLLYAWENTVPPNAPNTFLINIQPDQVNPLKQWLANNGMANTYMAPLARGRLIEINGKPADIDNFSNERARSMLTREFNLSYRVNLPDSNKLSKGTWLNHNESEASLEDRFAQRLGVDVGDTITFDLAGQSRTVKVVGLRKVKWDSFDVNFFALLSESVLQDVPLSYIASVHLPDNSANITRDLASKFPNITVFDVSALLQQVQNILNQVITAVQLLFLFTLAAGFTVLIAVLLATRDERIHEVALMRALGASKRQLNGALRIELAITGLMAGLLAAGVAQCIAWLLAHYVFDFPMSLSLWPWAVGIGSGAVLSYISGQLALRGVLQTPPLVTLRAI